MIRRKIQRPVIAAKPKPVTSGSSARHHMPPLLGCEAPRSLGASTFDGSAVGPPGTAAGRPARRRRARRPRRCRRGRRRRRRAPSCRPAGTCGRAARSGSVISTPSTEVPLVEPRSVTVTVSTPSTRTWSIRQCRPDSSESSRCRSARAERPIVTPPPVGNGTWRPASGPHTTTRWRPTPGCGGSAASAPHVSVEPCANPSAPIVPAVRIGTPSNPIGLAWNPSCSSSCSSASVDVVVSPSMNTSCRRSCGSRIWVRQIVTTRRPGSARRRRA